MLFLRRTADSSQKGGKRFIVSAKSLNFDRDLFEVGIHIVLQIQFALLPDQQTGYPDLAMLAILPALVPRILARLL
jgi:hypothetical protein